MKSFFALDCIVAFACAPSALADAATPKRPNIIVILGDDMGFSDLGCYGGEIHKSGRDENGAVGEYPAPFAFQGKLGPVTLDRGG